MELTGELMLDGLILGSDVAIAGSFIAVLRKLRTSGSSAGLSLLTLVAIVTARTLHLLGNAAGLHYRPAVLPHSMYAIMDLANTALGLSCLPAASS